MRLRPWLILLLVTCLPNAANGCSCWRESLKVVYEQSAQVFTAEVVKVRETRLESESDDEVVYKAVLRPKRMFKGRKPGTFTIKFTRAKRGVMEDGTETILVGGCYLDIEVGDEYVVLTSPGKSKDWPSWCSADFIESDRLNLEYLEELGKPDRAP
jgi:hypothetical protein